MQNGGAVNKEQCDVAARQQTALLLVMIAATASRFYHVDAAGLWGRELANAVAVLGTGWKEMVSGMVYGGLEPPGYKTVLYWTSQWLGRSSFELRMPSLFAGIGAVGMVYLVGLRIHGAWAGLLAASVLALSRQELLFSQEVHASALLLLALLVNFHAFLAVFFTVGRTALEDRAFTVTARSLAGRFSLVWQPSAPVSPCHLLQFWISGIAMLYLHYLAWAFLLAGLLVLVLLRRVVAINGEFWPLLKVAFLPLLLAYLPWVPGVLAHISKVMPMFAINPAAWTDIVPLLDVMTGIDDFPVRLAPLLLLPLLAGFHPGLSLQQDRAATGFQVTVTFFACMLLLFFLLGAYMPVRGNEALYLILHPLLVVLCAAGVAGMLLRCMPSAWSTALMTVLVVAVMLAQFYTCSAAFFNANGKPDIRPWIRIIARDTEFMDSVDRQVFVSFKGLNHYLDRYGVVPSRYGVVVNSMDEEEFGKIAGVVSQQSFYYIGLVDRPELKYSSPVLDRLLQQYGVMCRSGSDFIRIVKFSKTLPPDPGKNVPDCDRRSVFVNRSTVADRVQTL